MSYSKYKLALENLAKDMQNRYQSLLLDTLDGLKDLKYDIETVKYRVTLLLKPKGARKVQYSLIYKSQLKGQLKDVRSYEELIEYLENNYCAWFNVDLIESIRQVFVLKNKQTQDSILSAYKEHSKKYLARCCLKNVAGNETIYICKFPTDFREVNIKPKQTLLFVTKLREYFRIPANEIVINTNGELVLKDVPPVPVTDNLACPNSQPPTQAATCDEQQVI